VHCAVGECGIDRARAIVNRDPLDRRAENITTLLPSAEIGKIRGAAVDRICERGTTTICPRSNRRPADCREWIQAREFGVPARHRILTRFRLEYPVDTGNRFHGRKYQVGVDPVSQ